MFKPLETRCMWKFLNGGLVFESVSSRIFTFMDKQDIPVPNVIPRVLLDIIACLESDKLQFTWTISRNKDGFSFSAKQVMVPANRDPRDPAKTSGVDVETKPRKARKKSPSQCAHDHARRKHYRKKIAALKLKLLLANVSNKPGTLKRVKLLLQRGLNLWYHNQRNRPVNV